VTWGQVLDNWYLVECDLGEQGVDLGDDRILDERSWHWLSGRIFGLFDTPVAGYARLPIPNDTKRERIVPIWRTRIQSRLLGSGEG
jgi:hypothetical protein